MIDNSKDQRYKVGKKFFIYAPPFKGIRSKSTGEYISRRLQRITPPFRDAKAWQCSVYYFWWEFLRRHEGYHDCCIRGGKGKYKKLYADFGNIHEHDDFWKWWAQKVDDEFYSDLRRGERLFSEPPAGKIELAERSLNNDSNDVLTINIPLEVRTPFLVKQFRKLLKDHEQQVQEARKVSRAKYPVSSSVRLSSLYQALRVWDIEQEYRKTKKKYEKCDLAGIYVNEILTISDPDGEFKTMRLTIEKAKREGHEEYINHIVQEVRRRKSQSYTRYLTAAENYIRNVGEGNFPSQKK